MEIQNLLDEEFALKSYRKDDFKGTFEAIAEKTEYLEIDPSRLDIYSLISPRMGRDHYDVIRIDPVHADKNLFLPQNMKDLYFSADNGNIGSLSVDHFRKEGVGDNLLRDIDAAGFFYIYRDDESLRTIIPGKGLLTSLCHRLGIGRLAGGVDPIRDIYVASKLRFTDPFTFVLRNEGGIAKAFAVMAAKTKQIYQDLAVTVANEVIPRKNAYIKSWKYTHSLSEVFFAFADQAAATKKARIVPGIRLSFSDLGDAALSLEAVLYISGNYVILPYRAVQKRNEDFDAVKTVDEFCSMSEPDEILEKLDGLDKVEVESVKGAVDSIFSPEAIQSVIGAGVYKQMSEHPIRTGEGTMLDAMIEVLKIPSRASVYSDTESMRTRLSKATGEQVIKALR